MQALHLLAKTRCAVGKRVAGVDDIEVGDREHQAALCWGGLQGRCQRVWRVWEELGLSRVELPASHS